MLNTAVSLSNPSQKIRQEILLLVIPLPKIFGKKLFYPSNKRKLDGVGPVNFAHFLVGSTNLEDDEYLET